MEKYTSTREARSRAAKAMKKQGAVFLEGGQGHKKLLAQSGGRAQSRLTTSEKETYKKKAPLIDAPKMKSGWAIVRKKKSK